MEIRIDQKYFGDRHVLGAIDLMLRPAEPVVLCGPSGCGKTTLLNIIAGLDQDFKGSVPQLNKIGYVFQEPRLLPWKTIRQNIEIVLETPDHALVDKLIDDVGLTLDQNQPVSKISLGMARRVALARALVIRPVVLILDEPFVSLDPQRAEELRRLTYDLIQKYCMKTVFVTHVPFEAVQLGHFVQILSGQPTVVSKTVHIEMNDADRFNSTFVMNYLQSNRDQFAFS